MFNNGINLWLSQSIFDHCYLILNEKIDTLLYISLFYFQIGQYFYVLLYTVMYFSLVFPV